MSFTTEEEARLRRAMNLIGGAASTAGATPMRPRRQRRRAVLASLASAAAVLVAVGLVASLVGQDEQDPPGGASTIGQTMAEGIACSRLIVIGTVESVVPAGRQRVHVKMTVDEWIKPTSGGQVVEFTTLDPTSEGQERIETGVRALAYVPENDNLGPDFFTGRRPIASTKRVILNDLTKGMTIECPQYWQTHGPR